MLVEPDSIKRRTRSTTYRLPEDMLQDLDAVAKQEEVSQNLLVKQILDSYLRWEVSATKAGWVVMPRAVLMKIINELDEKSIIKIGSDSAKAVFKDISSTWGSLLDWNLDFSNGCRNHIWFHWINR